jgi:hypothetical protein
MNQASLVQFADCFNVVKIKPETHLKAQNRMSFISAATEHLGDFYVVVEGSLDVCMKIPIQQGAQAAIVEGEPSTPEKEKMTAKRPRMAGAAFKGNGGRLTFSRNKVSEALAPHRTQHSRHMVVPKVSSRLLYSFTSPHITSRTRCRCSLVGVGTSQCYIVQEKWRHVMDPCG